MNQWTVTMKNSSSSYQPIRSVKITEPGIQNWKRVSDGSLLTPHLGEGCCRGLQCRKLNERSTTLWCLLVNLRLQHSYAGKTPESFRKVHSITNYKIIWTLPTRANKGKESEPAWPAANKISQRQIQRLHAKTATLQKEESLTPCSESIISSWCILGLHPRHVYVNFVPQKPLMFTRVWNTTALDKDQIAVDKDHTAVDKDHIAKMSWKTLALHLNLKH